MRVTDLELASDEWNEMWNVNERKEKEGERGRAMDRFKMESI